VTCVVLLSHARNPGSWIIWYPAVLLWYGGSLFLDSFIYIYYRYRGRDGLLWISLAVSDWEMGSFGFWLGGNVVCACIPHTARRHIFFSSSSSGSCSPEFLTESCDDSRSIGYHIISILSRNAPEVRLKYETAGEGTPKMVWNAISRYATRRGRGANMVLDFCYCSYSNMYSFLLIKMTCIVQCNIEEPNVPWDYGDALPLAPEKKKKGD